MQFNWFKYTTIAVVCLFCSILVFAVYKAHTRGYSGSTGLDASAIRMMRNEAYEEFRKERQEDS